ncbi:MAG TPA: hypothetical protein PL169_19250 [Leptospiraceae bacterium]|nr:hypothetical protein [Leptospiraceae bacterium]HNM03190.1 hypothetical protein [Leptospiraceae bacterium]
MELLLNELSAEPLADNTYKANERMMLFAKAVKKAKEYNFNSIRSHYSANEIKLTTEYTLHNWLTDKKNPEIYRNYLFGKIVNPFINEEDTTIVDVYTSAKYSFEDISNTFPKTECRGLASAYLYETLSISFASMDLWKQTILSILIEKNGDVEYGTVLNIFSEDSFYNEDIKSYIERIGEIVLETTNIPPDKKKIHLADHHGKAELQAFCNKIKNSPYVIEMRSTNWGGNKFIRKIQKDGVIEVVLIKTDKRYALWIQTTGKNYRQTEQISEILDDDYS